MWHVNRSHGIAESDYRETNAESDYRDTNVDREATISLSPRYAAFMNREADGRLADRVFVSFHSNAGGAAKGRGTLGLYNGNNDKTTATPNQLLLAKTLAAEVNGDMSAQKGSFEHDWHDRGENITLDRDDIEFGEINNHYIHDEFDATIIEVAFHDNPEDAELLRDPKVRDAIARSTYKGLVKYFRAVDGGRTPATVLPPPPMSVYAESNASGSATISWRQSANTSYTGELPSEYHIYASTNGYGFDGGTRVEDGDTQSVTLSGYDRDKPIYFKVAGFNEGGESAASEVVAVLPSGGPKQVLIVDGFTRLDRELDPKQKVGGKTVDRVWPGQCNSRNYAVQVAAAIEAAAPGTHVATASDNAVISGDVQLGDYQTVVWILGRQSVHDHTIPVYQQAQVEKFLAGGGNLFITGSDIGFDLDDKNNGRAFYHDTLKARFVADSAKTYDVAGVPGGIFDGMKFSFDDGSRIYDVNSADVIEPQDGAKAALDYANGVGAAAIQAPADRKNGAIVVFGFPFETITKAADRAEVMRRVLEFFKSPRK